ncbi:DNA-directed RNA polymerase III subunit 1 [Nymphaea colorata]|nr:DNA-directed RNA polymerase III subunit 1 [Nymphaea colorata]
MASMTNFTKQPYADEVGPRKIKSIQFSTFSGTEVMNAAEVQVHKPVFYEINREPVAHGLLDRRMGISSKSGFCATCHADFTNCPGHFGYLKLVLPVFHIGYFKDIQTILQCICKSCAHILLPENERKALLKNMRNPRLEALQKKAYLKKVIGICKRVHICPHCGDYNGTVKKASMQQPALAISHQYSNSNDKKFMDCSSDSNGKNICILNPLRVLHLFMRVTDEDKDILYLYDRPEKLLITNIPVPPTPIRPSAFVDSGSMSNENDITSRLKTILQINNAVRLQLQDGNTQACMDNWLLLQNEVGLYINSDHPSIQSSNMQSQPLQGFVQRLKGKHGRFRGNLSGKRVNFTGRTVISPDPNLKITEVGIPILMAQILSYPERVSHHNIEKLRQRVRNGLQKYPGANYVILADGTKQFLKFGNREHIAEELKHGCIVERHLEDGDAVLFNRQPSLHRMSIMCHRAKIMPWRTLRFNESVCNPYNADFDGDEMNLHIPQTEEARAEALMLMGVQNNLCTPKNGQILVASTQDFLTSSFLITRKDTFYDRAAFSLMCSYMGDAMDPIDLPTPALLKPIELWTGKQLFSVLIRPHASMRIYVNLFLKEKNCMKNRGTMCPNDGFVYIRNSELLCGQVGKATLGNGNKSGLFSVLIRDYNAHAAASCMNRLAKLSARWIGNHGFTIGIDDVQPEVRLAKKNSRVIRLAQNHCNSYIDDYNKGVLQPQPGSTAAETLEAMITSELSGIREKVGEVCTKLLPWRNSPLIMSQCGSKGSLINICQMIGCVGQQSVGGRRAPNGFMERSLPHFLRNDKSPAAKGFVTNSFYTGLTATEFFFHTMGGREGLVDTAVKTADTGYMSRRLMKSLEDLSIHYDQTVRNASGVIVQLRYGEDGMDPSKMEGDDGQPLNLEHLFVKMQAVCPLGSQKCLSHDEILRIVDDRLSKAGLMPEDGSSSSFKDMLIGFIKKQLSAWNMPFDVRKKEDNYKDQKDVLLVAGNKAGISSQQLKYFLETSIHRYRSKTVEGATAVGAIGAHSIGEPGTQMTLKTFHFAGVASMNVTLGVPRIKEIINAAKNISTPIITAILSSHEDINVARIVKNRIESTMLGQVSKSIKIVYSGRDAYLQVNLDWEAIEAMHLEISSYTIIDAILKHPKIKLKRENIACVDDWELKIYPPASDKKKLDYALHFISSLLPNVVVKGIPTISRAIIKEDEKSYVDAEDQKKKKKLYSLLLEGTNLTAVMGIPGVVGEKTKSNHVIEIEQTLGIEAARQSIIDEIQFIMKNHGMTIDIRHMMLLADVMTFKGEVLGITRFGIKKMKDSVLMLASFEQTTDHLFDASVHGKVDPIEGVSECIIMGIPMPIGTGLLKIKQSLDQVPELKYGPDPLIS